MKKMLLTLAVLVSIVATFVIPAKTLRWEGKLWVEPQALIDTRLAPGSTFDVQILASEVLALYGYEFKLQYNTAVLSTHTAWITIGDIFEGKEPIPPPEPVPGYYVWRKSVSGGVVWLAVSQELGAVEGVSLGKGEVGWLVTIKFIVDDFGTSTFNLYGVKLSDPHGQPIGLMGAFDGLFSNLDQGYADLANWKAKEEHNKFDFTRDDDEMQSFYGNVMNFGTQPVVAKVVFNIFDPFGLYIATAESPAATIAPGAIQVLEAKWGGMQQSKRYIVEAQCWWGTATPDTAGLSIYTLEFTVAPMPKFED